MLEFIKINQVHDKNVVYLDSGFDCLTIICSDTNGDLYFECQHGRHYLAGQVEDDHYVGLYEKIC